MFDTLMGFEKSSVWGKKSADDQKKYHDQGNVRSLKGSQGNSKASPWKVSEIYY